MIILRYFKSLRFPANSFNMSYTEKRYPRPKPRHLHPILLFVQAASILFYSIGVTAEYHVGPGQPYTAIGDVAWESLQPGDAVYIHHRDTPYNEKWVIGVSGTAQAPILVSGVPDPDGNLPVITGENANTRRQLSFWNEKRGLLKIGGTSVPQDSVPSHIIIENLELRSARPPYTFTNDDGGVEEYVDNAASFYIEKGQHITLRNCVIHDSGNGIFIGVNNGQTQNILVEGNYIYGNGIENSYYQHNTYTAALGITYQFNRMGPLRAGCGGNNLKDRSAGLVVRYNWIEDGNRQLDLVDGEDSSAVVNHPAYGKTYVYGNILLETADVGNSQIVHYGGDSGDLPTYRKGTLYFYNNTVVSKRPSNTTLLRLSSADESAEVFNNILYVTENGSRLALLNEEGEITMSHNWLKQDWRDSHSDSFTGTIINNGYNTEGTLPGFLDFANGDYRPAPSSLAVESGKTLTGDLAADYPLARQYVMHRQVESRLDSDLPDMGALAAELVVAGDINGDREVDLADVILSLQILTDRKDYSVALRNDVGNNGRIAQEEAVYGLQLIAAGQQ